MCRHCCGRLGTRALPRLSGPGKHGRPASRVLTGINTATHAPAGTTHTRARATQVERCVASAPTTKLGVTLLRIICEEFVGPGGAGGQGGRGIALTAARVKQLHELMEYDASVLDRFFARSPLPSPCVCTDRAATPHILRLLVGVINSCLASSWQGSTTTTVCRVAMVQRATQGPVAWCSCSH